MPFDVKAALAKVTDPEKKAKLEAALAEAQGFIDVIEEVNTKAETEAAARVQWEADKTAMEASYKEAEKDFYEMVADKTASVKEKEEALAKLKQAEQDKLAAQARVGELMKRPAEIDISKFQTVEDAKRLEAGRVAYFGKFLKIQKEHAKLFPDQDLDPEKLLIDSLTAGKPLDEYYNETYKVADRKAALAKEAQDKHDKEVDDKGYQRALAEMRNPALRVMDSSDEPFFTPKEAKQPWEEPDMELPETQALVKELSRTVQ